MDSNALFVAVDFAIASKGQSLLDAYEQWRKWADDKVCCDYGLHIGVTWWKPELHEEMQLLTTTKGQIIL